MKFKELSVWSRFEFDRSGLSVCHGLESGPWIKTSARGYVKDTTPFSTDQSVRDEHTIYSQLKCTVGSINVGVIKL